MKVLLIGANGQLGTDMHRVFCDAGDTVFPYVHAQLDVCSEARVAEVLDETQPDLVLNTAAYHRVEECEKKSELAFQVNGTAPMQLAIACQKAGATLVHFSTDYVFGGYAKNTPYNESDRPAPLNVYGASKVLGEFLIPDYTDRYFILRVSGLQQPALKLSRHTPPGTAAGILGYPLDGPFDVEPGRIGQTETVSTEDAYGNGPVTRSITALRGLVRPGNSGGPMIDHAGQVVATVFAAITGSTEGRGGFAVPNSLVADQLAIAQTRTNPVSTESCAG